MRKTLAQRTTQALLNQGFQIVDLKAHWQTPNIVLLQTGGTISMTTNNSGVGRPNTVWLNDLDLSSVSETKTLFGTGIDSSQLQLTDVFTIIFEVQQILVSGRVPVITHGTDSMDTTAFILSQVFPDEPIIITGAFRPSDHPNPDGPLNLSTALNVARLAVDGTVPKVPYVVMDGVVRLASSLVKLDIESEAAGRGFRSYTGKVADWTTGQGLWSRRFLNEFEAIRTSAVDELEPIRQKILEDIQRRTFSFSQIEFAVLNESTPIEYALAILERLERGTTEGVVINGSFPNERHVIEKVLSLNSKGLPIFIQGTNNSAFERLTYPPGIQPFQLYYKLSLLRRYIQNPVALRNALFSNLAGEIHPSSVDRSYVLTVPSGDFYNSQLVSRGFISYFPNYELMKIILTEEIVRLNNLRLSGSDVELIIEGIGNGHIDLRNHGIQRPAATQDNLKSTLEAQDSLIGLLRIAISKGIKITISTRVLDTIPNEDYEIAKILADSGISFAVHPGRLTLEKLASEDAGWVGNGLKP